MSVTQPIPPFIVEQYDSERLRVQLFGDQDFIFQKYDPDKRGTSKTNFLYLCNYLENPEIAAKTMVAEHHYVDHDYLIDHSEYYNRCFAKYDRHCIRLHFFKNEFSQQHLTDALCGSPDCQNFTDELKKSYIGFMTIKPLPTCRIGRTCLKTYSNPEDKGKNARSYTTRHAYNVNLFGIELKVETLAFQEQDSVISACATSALWSALNATGRFFHHTIPSPVEITEAANEIISNSRVFPSEGLSGWQMVHVLIKNGVHPKHYTAIPTKKEFTGQIYAYSKCSLPVILNIALYSGKSLDDLIFVGYHSIVTSGFCLDESQIDCLSDSPNNAAFPLYSSGLRKLYVHDDNVGPFSRVHILDCSDPEGNKILTHIARDDELASHAQNNKNASFVFKYGAYDDVKDETKKQLIVGIHLATLVPLHHKMRIAFDEICNLCKSFWTDYLYSIAKYDKKYIIDTWEIYLETVNRYKTAEISNWKNIAPELRLKLLSSSLPKYLWIARGYKITGGKEKIIELVFDATDIVSVHMLQFIMAKDAILRDRLTDKIKTDFSSLSNLQLLHQWKKDNKGVDCFFL